MASEMNNGDQLSTSDLAQALPSTDEAMPSTDQAMPNTVQAMPSTDQEVMPSTDQEIMASTDQEAMPSTDQVMPSTVQAITSTDQAMPNTDQAMPGTDQEAMPSTDQAMPSTVQAITSTDQAMPSTDQEAMPSTDQAMPSTDQAMPSTNQAMPNTDQEAMPSTDQAMPSTDQSSSSSASSSPRQAYISNVEVNSESAAVLLESGFMELDVRVVTATHTNETPNYGPCSASVIVPLDVSYAELKQVCTHSLQNASSERQWCRSWLRPKDEVISILNINWWDCSEKLEEMYRVPRLARDCIEVFISGIVIWDQTIDDHAQSQIWLDQISAREGHGRILLWHSTYLPPRLPMELQADPSTVHYENKPSALCWYWIELPVWDETIHRNDINTQASIEVG